MKVSELRKNILVNEWLDNLNAAVKTENAYLLGLQAFTEFTGLTPDELIEEAEHEIENGVLMRRRKIKQHLIEFRKHIQDQGLADFSVRTRMTGVRSFYNSFEIELPVLQGERRRRARAVEENQNVPTKEDWQDILKVCDPLEKAIVLTGTSGGLASNEIRNLKLAQFFKGYDKESGITILEIIRGKTGVKFITFLSPEASNAIFEYINLFRSRAAKSATTKRLRQLDKQKIFNNEGYLFISRLVPDKFLENKDEELRKLSENAMQKLYRAISEKADKNAKKGFYNAIRSHTARKYFNSVLLNAGCDSFFVEYCMGHALDDTRAAYFRASPEKLKEIYKRYVPFLTIQKDLDISASPEYQAIARECEVLRYETARHVVERQEMQDIRAEIEQLKIYNEIIGQSMINDPEFRNKVTAELINSENYKNM